MAKETQFTELKSAINGFESKVDVPVAINDPQQREQWKSQANEAFDRLNELVEKQRQQVHAKLFSAIASQDSSQRPEIEELKHSDARIDEYMDVVKAHLAAFALGATDDGQQPDVEDQVLELRNASHMLTASLLEQEETITTWFAESFQPDSEAREK